MAEGAVIGLRYWADSQPFLFWNLVQTLIHAEACVAGLAHANLLLADPGVLHRSRETCYPLPSMVAERLRAGDTLADISENLVDASDDSSYCVRCCVWRRPPPSAERPERAMGEWSKWIWQRLPRYAAAVPCAGAAKSHHCRICQRCVVAHDHHCGVLGRCIAARNMPWFMTLIFMSQLAAITVAVGLLGAVWQIFGARAASYALLCMAAYCCVAVCFMLCSRQLASCCMALASPSSRQQHQKVHTHIGDEAMPAAVEAEQEIPVAVRTRLPNSDDELERLPVARVVRVGEGASDI